MRRPFYIVVLALLAVIALTQVVVAQQAQSSFSASQAGCRITFSVDVQEEVLQAPDTVVKLRVFPTDNASNYLLDQDWSANGTYSVTADLNPGTMYQADLWYTLTAPWTLRDQEYFLCQSDGGTGGTDGSGTGGTDGSGTGGTDGSGTGGTDGSGTGGTDGSGTGGTDGSGTGGTDGSGTGGTDGSGTGGTDGSGTGGTDGSGTGGLPADDDVVVQPRLIPGPPFNPGDDRLNRQAWAPVAVYCEDSSSQVRVYAINPDNGRGSLVLNVDYSDFDQAASGANALIASQGGIQLYLTMDGDWVVVAPQADGKQYQFAFDGCA